MGCDIHLFVEYKRPGIDRWWSFGSEFRLDRNYQMFAALAGVRNYSNVVPVAHPRGVPGDISWNARSKYHYYICEERDPYDSSQQIEKDVAAQWIAEGSSELINKNWVTNPDAHDGSWLTVEEFAKAVGVADSAASYKDRVEYRAVLAALRALQRADCEVRVVFWFDN